MFRSIACALLFCMTAAISQSQNDSLALRDRGYVLSVDVDLVTVAATVIDESGKYVNDLQAGDFRVLEDGQEQKISFFSHDAQVPVSLGVLIDTSGSLQDKLAQGLQVVRAIASKLSSGDEMFVITFDSHASMRQGFTDNPEDIQQSLRGFHAHGDTAVYDAIVAGLHEMKAAKHQKRILVLVTDGFDSASKTTADQAEDLVRRSDVLLYAIGIDDPDNHPPRGRPKYHIYEYMLGKLSRAGGGRVVKLYTGGTYDMYGLAVSLLGEFHQEYAMGYYPAAGAVSEKWRNIDVRVTRPGTRILTERLHLQRRDQ
jgi:Ca-activated chloride channel family protein